MFETKVYSALYELAIKDHHNGNYLPPAGTADDPYVRAYQDGWDCADRLRNVQPSDIIGDRPMPVDLFKDVLYMDLLDRATGEGRR